MSAAWWSIMDSPGCRVAIAGRRGGLVKRGPAACPLSSACRLRLVCGSAQERRRALHRRLEADALHGDTFGKGAVKARGEGGVEQNENAAVGRPADEPAEGLLQAEPRQHVVIAGAAQRRPPRLVQDVGARPGDAVEDEKAERASGHVDAVEIG